MAEVIGEWGEIRSFQVIGELWPSVELSKTVDRWGEYGESFGHAVACSADGNTVVAGICRPLYDVRVYPQKPPRVQIYTRFSGLLLPETTLTMDPAWQQVASFGTSVAISRDGSTIFVGAAEIGAEGNVYCFTRIDGNWVGTPLPFPAIGSSKKPNFGYAVALNEDGTKALVSACGQSTDSPSGAVVYYYVKQNGEWVCTQIIQSTDAQRDGSFGASITMNAEGTLALFGCTDKLNGRVEVYSLINDTWVFQRKLEAATLYPQMPPRVIDSAFGSSVAMNAEGTLVLIGAPTTHVTVVKDGVAEEFISAGKVHVFQPLTPGGTDYIHVAEIVPAIPENHMKFGSAIALNGSGEMGFIGTNEASENEFGTVGSILVFN